MKTKKKTVKAWAVIRGKRMLRNGLGELMIGSKKRASGVFYFNRSRKVGGMKITKCTITYLV